MKIEMADVLIVLGGVMLLLGLYLIAWPLVPIAIGGTMVFLGLRVP
mgnify:CR=1 FL=1